MKYFVKKIVAVIYILSASLLCLNAVESESNSGVERYALYIGSNIGGAENQTLLYAASDALSLQKTMKEIGGVSDSNSILLYEPTRNEVDNALAKLSERIEKNSSNSRRSEFIFYYSGHSDEDALLLGNNRYDYSQLKESITNVPSDVHVVILDSCYSGNFIRAKGGKMKKSFLVDESTVVKGHAYLSSSSSAEVSQESDEIGSSFFTNAIVSGLRGAADTSGDKKVSLNELYTYAFNETLVKTESSSEGPQHPNYNITLVGSGDLILSDISSSDSFLMIPKDIEGKIIIKDRNDKLVSEINKSDSSPVYLSLEADAYIVTVITDYATLTNKITIAKNSTYVLDTANFTKSSKSTYRSRGGSFVEEEDFDDDDDFDEDDLNDLFNLFNYNSDEKVDEIHISFSGENIFFTKNDVRVSAGIIGSIENNVYLIQGSSIFNIANNVRGIQCTSIFNIANDVLGAQGSSVFNIAKNVQGVQGTAVFNIAGGEVKGVQGSGVFNIADSLKGIQGAGVFNISGSVKGIQGAGVFNIAQDLIGVQASSVINIANNVKGLQIGMINISDDCDGVMIGLFNYCKNGIRDFGITRSSDKIWTVEFKNGTKMLYSDVSYSAPKEYFIINSAKNKEDAFCCVNFGLGHRFELGILYLDTEIMTKNYYIYSSENNSLIKQFSEDYRIDLLEGLDTFLNCPAVRFDVGIQLGALRLFAGSTLEFMIADYNEAAFVGTNKNGNKEVIFGENVKGYFSYELGAAIKL